MNVIDLKYIPEDLDDIKPLLPSLASKCVPSRYEQTSSNVFQLFAFGNINILCWPPVNVTIISKVNPE